MTLFATTRLTLRYLTSADAPFIVELMNERAYHENIGDRGVRTVPEGEKYIADKYVASYARHGYGMYLAELKESQLPIGICGLVKRDSLSGPDVGFAIRQSHWAQGLGFEAANATVDYARDKLFATEIYGVVAPGNHKSIRILERIGLRYQGPWQLPNSAESISLYRGDLGK